MNKQSSHGKHTGVISDNHNRKDKPPIITKHICIGFTNQKQAYAEWECKSCGNRSQMGCKKNIKVGDEKDLRCLHE